MQAQGVLGLPCDLAQAALGLEAGLVVEGTDLEAAGLVVEGTDLEAAGLVVEGIALEAAAEDTDLAVEGIALAPYSDPAADLSYRKLPATLLPLSKS
jgi:hypothetical protein